MSVHLSEGEAVPDDLTEYWRVSTSWLGRLASRFAHPCVHGLAEYIIEQGYSKRLFPGTSMYTLLVALPQNGMVSYKHTLSVTFKPEHQNVQMVFNIWRTRERRSEDLNIQWSTTCQPSEVIGTFEHFLNEYPEWSSAARSK